MTPALPPRRPAGRSPAGRPAFGAVAAASVIAECLRVQATVVPRSAFARLIGRSPLSRDSRSWYLGALGEIDVAQRLESLGEGWVVLHSVPIGTRGSDIDHVVIGAAGVFTINSKLHDGARVWVGSRRILVNGQKTDYLRNTRYEAARTQKLLLAVVGTEVPVHGMTVIVGARQVTIREQPEDVVVLEARQLVRWLTKQKPRLDPPQLAAVATAVRLETTWSHTPASMPNTSGFAALHREVGSARRTRIRWAILVLLVVLGTLIPLSWQLYSRALGG